MTIFIGWKHCGKRIYKEQNLGYRKRTTAIFMFKGNDYAYLCPFCHAELNETHYTVEGI